MKDTAGPGEQGLLIGEVVNLAREFGSAFAVFHHNWKNPSATAEVVRAPRPSAVIALPALPPMETARKRSGNALRKRRSVYRLCVSTPPWGERKRKARKRIAVLRLIERWTSERDPSGPSRFHGNRSLWTVWSPRVTSR